MSGRDEAALRAQADRYADWLSRSPDADWSAVLGTAALHRTHFAARASVSARDAAEATAALRALGAGRPHGAVSLGTARERGGKLAFLFTGQGAQQLGMGRALAESRAAFRATFEDVCGQFDALLDMPLRVVLFAEEGSAAAAKLNETAIRSRHCLRWRWRSSVSWKSWGIRPDVLLGHSIGELAAAHVAGVWSLKRHARVAAARGRLMQALPEGGAMMAVAASEAEVLPLLEQYAGVEIAGLNGPRSTVISGDEAGVRRDGGALQRRGPPGEALAGEPRVPLETNGRDAGGVPGGGGVGELRKSAAADREQRDGAAGDDEELCSAEYWVRQVRSPVRFLDGVRVLEEEGARACSSLVRTAC